MKKFLSVFLAVMLVFAMSAPVYAKGMDKLQGGFERIVKSPTQLYDGIKGEFDSNGWNPFALVGGLLKGSFFVAKDVIHGFVDIVTFPVDIE